MKKTNVSETTAACNLKLIDLMKICEYLRSMSFLDLDARNDLGPMSFTDEDLTGFFQKPLAHCQPNFKCKLVGTSK